VSEFKCNVFKFFTNSNISKLFHIYININNQFPSKWYNIYLLWYKSWQRAYSTK